MKEETEVDQAVEELETLAESGDIEMAHYEADKVILEFVPDEVREAYEKVPKWYA